ncbi:VRR-NUC domain-containing protein [Clostridium estertheticum]|uniref:VRR-NUC domain-containing protein n=1 Tax=Clostridium estertheticum TaxID=238834 RepID=A0AA47EJ76_9CLOT|nr:VRR-NUC domain-containing protein [Clostridium estertheticum]MBU3155164.1 VRR-NUC domain-containing protein [Clostridium estertheticum]WAG61217.1 VRR-NUC domain-containing protein [Clostridium estertheticum]
MRETRIEKRLIKEIEKIGGKALKFVSPGVTGVPDRIVLLPHGKMIFVELKAPGKKESPMQRYRAKEYRNLGFDVRCIDSVELIIKLIEEVRGYAICTS